MYPMAQLQTFTKEELFTLLSTCAYQLSMAYQEIQDHSFWLTSNEASIACEYLRFEIEAVKKPYLIH
jgi:hypothetical protein